VNSHLVPKLAASSLMAYYRQKCKLTQEELATNVGINLKPNRALAPEMVGAFFCIQVVFE